MNYKEILLNLGTPVVETLIAEDFEKIVIFQKENDEFVVIESRGIVPSRAVYPSEDEIRSEFPDMKLLKVSESIYYLLEESPKELDLIEKIETLSEKLRSIEGYEKRITRHIYQLEGLDTVITSLLEPMPTEILLSMVMDAVSELFVTSIALYRFVEDSYVMFTSFGSEDFPDELPGELSDAAKYSGVMDAKQHLKDRGILVPISEELKNVYILYLKREDPFSPEEKALIGSIAKIISRTREYVKGKQTIIQLDRLLSQARFVVESLGEFARKVLTARSISQLEGMIADMIREMLQIRWLGLYKKDGSYRLIKVVKVEDIELPEELDVEEFEGYIKDNLRKTIKNAPKTTWMAMKFSPEGVGEYIVLLGPPITEEMILGDVFDTYLNITLNTASRAFESIKFYEEVLENERRIRNLYETLKAIDEFTNELNSISDVGEVYEKLFEFAKERFDISGIEVKVGGMDLEFGKLEGKFLEIEADLSGLKLGSIKYYKKEDFTDTDRIVLDALTKGTLSVLRSIYLVSPDRNVIGVEELILRFLREKAIFHGFDESKLRFYLLKNVDDVEKIDFGVGIAKDEGVLVATDKDKEEIEKQGFDVEEI